MQIFLCDDEEIQQDVMYKRLEQFAKRRRRKFKIERFDSGIDLLYRMQHEDAEPDLIFLDINMPYINGLDVAKRLREWEYDGQIIFVTASKQYFLDAFDVGAFHYIVKYETPEQKIVDILEHAMTAIENKKSEGTVFSY